MTRIRRAAMLLLLPMLMAEDCKEKDCADGIDNDDDGAVDCDDSNCGGKAECEGCPADVLEPNDTSTTATELPIGSGESVEFPGMDLSVESPDWAVVVIPGGHELVVDIDYDANLAQIDLFIGNSRGDAHSERDTPGQLAFNNPDDGPRTVYVRASLATDPIGGCATYDILLSVDESFICVEDTLGDISDPDDAWEMFWFEETLLEITDRTTHADAPDWYFLEVDHGCDVAFEGLADNGVDLALQVYDGDLTQQFTSDLPGNSPNAVFNDEGMPVEYYFEVWAAVNNVCVDYDLEFFVDCFECEGGVGTYASFNFDDVESFGLPNQVTYHEQPDTFELRNVPHGCLVQWQLESEHDAELTMSAARDGLALGTQSGNVAPIVRNTTGTDANYTVEVAATNAWECIDYDFELTTECFECESLFEGTHVTAYGDHPTGFTVADQAISHLGYQAWRYDDIPDGCEVSLRPITDNPDDLDLRVSVDLGTNWVDIPSGGFIHRTMAASLPSVDIEVKAANEWECVEYDFEVITECFECESLFEGTHVTAYGDHPTGFTVADQVIVGGHSKAPAFGDRRA